MMHAFMKALYASGQPCHTPACCHNPNSDIRLCILSIEIDMIAALSAMVLCTSP